MYKAVIFDLDGVIVNTDHFHYLAWKTIADKEKIEFDEIINNKLRGLSRADSLNIILKKAVREYSEEEKHEMLHLKNQVYIKTLETMNENQILNGIIDVIRTLKEDHIKIAIGSSSKNARFILEKINLLDVFDFIVDGNDIERSKPFPDVFEIAAKNLGVNPSECIVVEDADAGIIAAKDAGMFAFAVSEARFSKLADYRANDIKEIFKILSK